MTPQEFENLLILTRVELSEAFKFGKVEDDEVHTKMILDFQQKIAVALFTELNSLRAEINQTRGDLLKNNRDQFGIMMKKLEN